MFNIIKKSFISTLGFFNHNILLTNSLKCYSLDNEEFKIRHEIISVNNKEPIFYPYKIKKIRCVGSCNTIDDPYGKTCFANDIENIGLKEFNLLAQNNETINIEKHKSFGYKCKLNKDACNNKQIWSKDTCKCECKKINTKEVWDSEFIWNPSVFICECNKYCDMYEYLDHKNCICRGKMAESLTEKWEKNINETLDVISSSDNYKKTYDSCVVYIVLISVFLLINISMVIYVYLFLYLNNRSTNSHYFWCLNINGY